MPGIRDYPEAASVDPSDAFVIDRIGTGTMFVASSNLQSGNPYFCAFEFLGGTPPLTNEVMGGHVFTAAVNTTINFAGIVVSGNFVQAQGHCETNPASSFTATIYKVSGGVSTSIGTMVISTLGAFTFAVAAIQSFAQGDSLKFVAPSGTDASLANLWWTIPAVLA